jgi:hypothetical protein
MYLSNTGLEASNMYLLPQKMVSDCIKNNESNNQLPSKPFCMKKNTNSIIPHKNKNGNIV